MKVRSVLLLVALVGAAFFGVGALLAATTRSTRSAAHETPIIECPPDRASRSQPRGSRAARAGAGKNLAGLASALREIPTGELDARSSDVADLAEASRHESEENRRQRLENLERDLRTRMPEVSPETVELFRQENDRLNAQNRQVRADYLVGEINEDDYLEKMMENIRVSTRTYQERLTDEELHRLLSFERDSDPFVPETWWQDPKSGPPEGMEDPGPPGGEEAQPPPAP